MSSYRIRRARRVRTGDGFTRYVADVSDARLRCFQGVVTQLRAGSMEIVKSGYEPDVFYVFACDVVISAVVKGDDIVLATVTDVGTE